MIPQEEFAYNESAKKTIGKSPFEVVYDLHPRGVSKLRDLKD